MKSIKKHKNSLIKYGICFIILLSIFLINFSFNNKVSYVSSLSIPEIAHLPKQTLFDRKDEINLILDQEFQSKCSESEIINMEYHDPYSSNICDFEVFTHYIEAKIFLGKKSELLENEKLISLLNSTYYKYRPYYANKSILHPLDNNWNHLIISMNLLDLLDQKEKDFWIIKYSNLKLDEDFPKFPQQWNRIWLFRTFNISDVDTLAKYCNLNISQIENVCSYVPPPDAYDKENIFKESKTVMFGKYLVIKHFCNVSLR